MRAALGLLILLGAARVHGTTYGPAKSDAECQADHEAFDGQYLSGEREPAVVTGPPDECDTPGCTDGFWAPVSRYQNEPSCPKELVQGLTGWLREMAAHEGGEWARDFVLLQPCDLWRHLRGRTTWVVGDSVVEYVARSISTFMLEYWDKEHWEVTLSEDKRIANALLHGAMEGVRAGGRRVPFWCFQMGTAQDPGRLCYLKADRVKRSLHILNVLPSISQPGDTLLINVGVHYNDMEDLSDDATMLAFALRNHHLPRHRVWVETSAQHYETPTGMFNMSRPIKEQLCYPPGHWHGANVSLFGDGSIGVPPGGAAPEHGSHADVSLQRLLAGGERNLATQPVVDSAGLPTLRTWNYSLPLYQFHTHIHGPEDRGECSEVPCDCTHVCHPSWPQVVLAALPRLLDSLAAADH